MTPWHPESARLTGMGGAVQTPWLAGSPQEETQPFGVCWVQGDCPHQGIDVAAPPGTPIVSQVYGTVDELRDPQGFGNYQVIHTINGIDILLGHEDRWLVPPGPVVPGEQIALEGSSGFSTGPHLHFGESVGGHWIDPRDLLYQAGGTAQTAASVGQAPRNPLENLAGALKVPSVPDLAWRVGLLLAGFLLILVGVMITFQPTSFRVGETVATRGTSEVVR